MNWKTVSLNWKILTGKGELVSSYFLLAYEFQTPAALLIFRSPFLFSQLLASVVLLCFVTPRRILPYRSQPSYKSFEAWQGQQQVLLRPWFICFLDSLVQSYRVPKVAGFQLQSVDGLLRKKKSCCPGPSVQKKVHNVTGLWLVSRPARQKNNRNFKII